MVSSSLAPSGAFILFLFLIVLTIIQSSRLKSMQSKLVNDTQTYLREHSQITGELQEAFATLKNDIETLQKNNYEIRVFLNEYQPPCVVENYKLNQKLISSLKEIFDNTETQKKG